MSKKKNTLKDLDEFLKQQASSLVSPTQLGGTTEQPQSSQAADASTSPVLVNYDKLAQDLKLLAHQQGDKFRSTLYTLIIELTETQQESLPEDKMLINTALYLKHGSRWKEAIREYWNSKFKVQRSEFKV